MGGITLKNVSKIFPGGVAAVRNFNLEIGEGEFVVLVGPSGCGKSTTLRMIAGLEEISAGDIYIADRRANGLEPKDREIAMVFQNYALYPHMTVFENIAFGLMLRKTSRNEMKQKVEEAAGILAIGDLLGRKPKELSGGQRQRVALGRAIVRNPSAFLLDEPLSNLDAQLRTTMRTEISKLHKRLGATFVYVTHDQVEAMTMGERIVVMKDGEIQQVDTPETVYYRPANIFVASFIGSPPINLIDGVIEKSGSRLTVRAAGIVLPLPLDRNLSKYENQRVVIGLRPEDLRISGYLDEAETSFRAHLDLMEMLGSEICFHLSTPCGNLISKTPARNKIANTADNVTLNIDCDRLLLFDAKDGKLLQ
jgi:multiple sugar transport system ATP-binding protein